MSALAADALPASLFNGEDAAERPVTLCAEGEDIVVRAAGEHGIRIARSALVWDTPPGAPRALLRGPGGMTLVLRPGQAPEALGVVAAAPSLAERIGASRLLGALAGVALAGMLALGLAWALPQASTFAADLVPMQVEAHFGHNVLREIDRRELGTSALATDVRAQVQARFDALVHAAAMPAVRLEFRAGRSIGANAFALPGRTVIVTDEIVALLGASARLDAVLAHELGHVAHRDASRTALHAAGLAGVISLLLGDQAGYTARLAETAPRWLLQAGHSRDRERDADRFAFALLRATGASAADFADAMELMASEREKGRALPRYLSTHPPTRERIDAARRAP